MTAGFAQDTIQNSKNKVDTTIRKIDTTVQCIPTPVVKLMIKDILRGDSLAWELKYATKEMEEYKAQLRYKDSIGISKERKLTAANMQIGIERNKTNEWVARSETLSMMLKREKSGRTFDRIIGGGIIGGLIYLLIKK